MTVACRSRWKPRSRQRGQALLGLLMLLGIALSAFVYNMIDPAQASARREVRTEATLREARDALIGRAASDDNRPGSLPCPDTDNDGVAELFAGVDCPSYIGRLPWRTLGLPDPRDDSGERFWYVLSPVFRDNSAAGMLDVDTKGNLTAYRDSTAITLTTEAVALIFAPGPVVPGQLRDAANANNPANYLDTASGVNNAIAAGPFISARTSSTFNDRLLVITTAELMPVAEMRVAREMLALLSAYRAASSCACYPWASNNFDDDSVTGREDGMVPIEDALPETWSSLGITVPSYMIGSNEWGKRFFYTVAPVETASHSAGTLTVNGVSKNLVLITPGPAGASRPSLTLSDYIDDAENSDNGVVFITPSSTAYARDRIYTIP
jgi:hypothetical protein